MTATLKSALAAAASVCAALAVAPAAADGGQRIISTHIETVEIAQGDSVRAAPCPGCRLTLALGAPTQVGGVTCYNAGRAEIHGPSGAVRFGARIDQTHMIEMGGSTVAMISLTRDGARAPSVMEVEVFAGTASVRLDSPASPASASGTRRVAALGR